MTKSNFQIVLVKAEDDTEIVNGEWTTSRGDGINAVPKLRVVQRLKAAMWKREATENDLAKARTFADSEGYKVVMVPANERNPLGYAKARF